jgi:hypothetical protein
MDAAVNVFTRQILQQGKPARFLPMSIRGNTVMSFSTDVPAFVKACPAVADIIQSNIEKIVSPFAHILSHNYLKFTPTELNVAFLPFLNFY